MTGWEKERALETVKSAGFSAGIVFALFVLVVICMASYPVYNVWSSGLSGKAQLERAKQNRQILIEQAKAEKESAKLRAEAIEIVGVAAKNFPEYRYQEFLGAFAEALKDGKMNQIIYVPTEANVPLLEAGKR